MLQAEKFMQKISLGDLNIKQRTVAILKHICIVIHRKKHIQFEMQVVQNASQDVSKNRS